MARDEAYSFFVFRENDDALLGGLSFGYVRRGVSQSASLGYWMGEPYAGKGYMTRAVRAACAYVFDKQGLHRVEASCLPTNEPSRRLLERVGFRKEGYARSYLNINGEWRDHLLFALLDNDAMRPGNALLQDR
jgi:ribosomal-protein-alanine N-acetyltransferase